MQERELWAECGSCDEKELGVGVFEGSGVWRLVGWVEGVGVRGPQAEAGERYPSCSQHIHREPDDSDSDGCRDDTIVHGANR